MLNFLKTPKGLIITAIVLLVLVIIISYNWTTVKGWFSSAPGSSRNQSAGSSAKQIGCIGARRNLLTGEIIPNSGYVTVNGIAGSQRCPNENFGL